MNSPSTFITGGGGMLATAFRKRLPDATFADKATFDLGNPQHLSQLLKNKPKVVINCAAYTKVDQAELDSETADGVNGVGVGALAKTCQQIGATLVHFSTDYVFDGTLRRPLLPTDPVGPASAYGRSKLLGERAVQQNPPPRWLILRTSWLFGPGGPNFPTTMIAAARAGKNLSVIDDQVGSPTYTHDLAEATLALLATDARGIFHIANAGQTTWRDFALETFSQMGIAVEVAATTSEKWIAARPTSATRPHYSVLDTAAYTAATGQSLRDWKAALRDYLDNHAV